MSRPKFDLITIERWAYSSELDEEFESYQDTDADWFDRAIGNECTTEDLFRFAADSRCLKRFYFVQLLIPHLCWIYRTNKELPFHFSRLQGIMKYDEYIAKVTEHAKAVYEIAAIIEKMRLSSDPALQALAKALLDYRHELLKPKANEYTNLLRSIYENVLPLFESA